MKDDKLTRRDFIKKTTLTGAGLTVGGGLLIGFNALAQEEVYLPLIFKSLGPTEEPTIGPPEGPTVEPTEKPTTKPTEEPTTEPTEGPTVEPTEEPTTEPTEGPTVEPTEEPTVEPTEEPTVEPTEEPTPPPPTGPRVVHVYDSNATDWDFGSSYYGNHVDQEVINNMVDNGVMTLTDTSAVADAWRAFIPNYTPGEAIAIKVNFNNAGSCGDSDNAIDALIHPVNAIVRGLRQIGVAEEDIWVYEAVRRIPSRFVNGCLYPGVQFFADCCQSPGWSSGEFVTFNPPSGPTPPPMRIPGILVNATYLINMPIIKTHDCAGVSLGFKNHFGTVRNPGALHNFVCPGGSNFRTDYSPFVDIYQNPHVGAKTILTIGDGLFGAWSGYTGSPSRWTTFGDSASNSLFFATDPVAIDCVMYDLLADELGAHDAEIEPNADIYLSVAADAGLGTFEHGDPWGSGYSTIDYVKREPLLFHHQW